jgi:WD40 repeat protein
MITSLGRDFSKIISGSEDGTVKMWDIHHGQCIVQCQGHSSGVSCISQLDDTMIFSASWDSVVKQWNYSDILSRYNSISSPYV